MSLRKSLAPMVFSMLFCGVLAAGPQVFAQAADASVAQADTKNDETNLDTQLYLLVATNQEIDNAKLPAVLDPVIKQLRASLPFKNYKLAATLINRVKNEGRLNLQWIGGPLISSPVAANITPSFNEFHVNAIKLVRDQNGRERVKMDGFGFGARIPVQTATLVASNAPAGPIINYEHTGLNTDISMSEGEPVIVGTLNVGPSGDAIILVMSARRTAK